MKADEIHVAARLRSLLVLIGITIAAAAMLFAPNTAPAELTVQFTDVCGFVRTEATYVGQGYTLVKIKRNGIGMTYWHMQVPPQKSEFHYAGEGDTLTLSWELNGVAHTAEHVHHAPSDCAEPKVSFRLINDCAMRSTLAIDNAGKGRIDLEIRTDAGSHSITVPPGGADLSIVGGLAVWNPTRLITVSMPHPEPQSWQSVLRIAEITRPACDSPPNLPDTPQSSFEATCGKVSIVWINGKKAFVGDLRVYRNGSVAAEQKVEAGGIYQFQLDVAEGDAIAVGGSDGPHGSYTYRKANARCGANVPGAPANARLPITGVAIGSLVLGAAGLIGLGLLMQRFARRRWPRSRA